MDSGVRAGQLRVVAGSAWNCSVYVVLAQHHTSVTPEGRLLHFWEVFMDGQVAVWGEHTISCDTLVSESK